MTRRLNVLFQIFEIRIGKMFMIKFAPYQPMSAEQSYCTSIKFVKTNCNRLEPTITRYTHCVAPSFRTQAINIAHQGHQGLVKTKKLLRTTIWFPGIDELTENIIKHCIACQATGPAARPLQMTKLPPAPWHNERRLIRTFNHRGIFARCH